MVPAVGRSFVVPTKPDIASHGNAAVPHIGLLDEDCSIARILAVAFTIITLLVPPVDRHQIVAEIPGAFFPAVGHTFKVPDFDVGPVAPGERLV